MTTMFPHFLRLCVLAHVLALVSCQTGLSPAMQAQVDARNASISAEPAPSSSEASGAMQPWLPYWRELAKAMKSAVGDASPPLQRTV